jgi:cobalt transporter subunit CbtB
MSQISSATRVWGHVPSKTIPQTVLLTVIGAVLLGCSLLFVAGFAGPEVLHNAAHDVRHGFSFPCH